MSMENCVRAVATAIYVVMVDTLGDVKGVQFHYEINAVLVEKRD